MAQPISQNNQDTHTHFWTNGHDKSEQKCFSCDNIKVSQTEYNRRTEAWHGYYHAVRLSEPFADYLEMRKAYKAGDRQWMNQLLDRIKQRAKPTDQRNQYGEKVWDYDESAYLKKPPFPDPETTSRYVIED